MAFSGEKWLANVSFQNGAKFLSSLFLTEYCRGLRLCVTQFDKT